MLLHGGRDPPAVECLLYCYALRLLGKLFLFGEGQGSLLLRDKSLCHIPATIILT